ncbi:MAG: 6-bladed beta-propeller [Candidatus Saccharibacteria bacterium]
MMTKLTKAFSVLTFAAIATLALASHAHAAAPTVTTNNATNLSANSGTLNGSAPSAGTSPITKRGFEYGLTNTYTNSADEDVPVNYPYLKQWGNDPSAQGQFMFATDVATDSNGNVYTADSYNRRIQKFDSSGNFITAWGDINVFSTINCIAVDSLDNVYVVDGYSQHIYKYDSSGSFIRQLNIATGCITVDSANNIYVADSNNHTIKKYDANDNLLTQWGSQGSGDGQFGSIVDLAIDSSNNVYVVDIDNRRIQKFTSNGAFILKWGSFGSGDGQFIAPINLVVDSSGNIFVLDLYGTNVQKFDSSGSFILKWGSVGTGNNQFASGPRGITVDSSGNVYVGDNENGRIQKFDNSGNYLLQWGHNPSLNGQFSHPYGVVTDTSNNIYVADRNNNRIQKFDSNGSYITQWGSSGSGDGQFDNPTGLAIDSSNNIYVVDTANNRIQKFNSSGMFISKFGTSGSGNGQLSSPYGIAVDSNGNMFVADTQNNRIQKFNSSGSYVSQWGTLGSNDGQFNLPYGIAVDTSNNLYVADRNNNRVQKFDNNGAFMLKWGSQGSGDSQFILPVSLATSPQGYVFVSDTENRRMKIFDESGTFITKWGQQTMSAGGFDFVVGLTMNNQGQLILSDTTYNRIQIFTQTTNSGDFSANIADLDCNATYHYHAYAINNEAVTYGDDATFTTSACPSLPVINTGSATRENSQGTSARIKYMVTDEGNEIPSTGVEYGLDNSYGATSTGSYYGVNTDSNAYLYDLTCGTTYHYRAYAENSAGRAYGEDRTFTLPCPEQTDLSLTAKLLNAQPITSGDTANYEVNLKNLGPGYFAGDGVIIYFNLPTNTTYDSVSISPNDLYTTGCADVGPMNQVDSIPAFAPYSEDLVICEVRFSNAVLPSTTELTLSLSLIATSDFAVGNNTLRGALIHDSFDQEPDIQALFEAVQTGTPLYSIASNNIFNLIYGAAPTSSDTDTIPDTIENAAPNNGDGNNDGTPDAQQSNVTSLPNADGRYITLVVPNGVTIDATIIEQARSFSTQDKGKDYPLGFVSFTATTTPGATIPVELYFYTDARANSFTARKYNATSRTYSDIPGAALTDVTIGGQHAVKLTYSITDGGALDQDGTANGTIVDPVGLATTSLAGTGESTWAYLCAMGSLILAGLGLTLASTKLSVL